MCLILETLQEKQDKISKAVCLQYDHKCTTGKEKIHLFEHHGLKYIYIKKRKR